MAQQVPLVLRGRLDLAVPRAPLVAQDLRGQQDQPEQREPLASLVQRGLLDRQAPLVAPEALARRVQQVGLVPLVAQAQPGRQ